MKELLLLEARLDLSSELVSLACPQSLGDCPPTSSFCVACGAQIDTIVQQKQCPEEWLLCHFRIPVESFLSRGGRRHPNCRRGVRNELITNQNWNEIGMRPAIVLEPFQKSIHPGSSLFSVLGKNLRGRWTYARQILAGHSPLSKEVN